MYVIHLAKKCYRKYQIVASGVCSFCITLALSMNFDTQGFGIDLFSLSVVFSALFYADLQIKKHMKYNHCLMCIVSFLIACLWLISKGFSIDDTLCSLYNTPIQIVKSIIYVIGITYLLNRIGVVFHYVVASPNRTIALPLKRLQSYISWLIIMLVVWLPHTIISHPASIECDVWDSLYQYYGRKAFTAHHPPVFTVLIGWFTKLGTYGGGVSMRVSFCGPFCRPSFAPQ